MNGAGRGKADPFDLGRFLAAQASIYERAVEEIRSGRKRSHWMWFVFPQIDGLGMSSTSRYYAIKSRAEAVAYLDHPLLGKRLEECTLALIALESQSASEIFGYPDDLKLKSSMTLFAEAAGPGSPYEKVIEKYFGGERDGKTLALLDRLS